MVDAYKSFAETLAQSLLQDGKLTVYPGSNSRLQLARENGELANLELTPFISQPQTVSAQPYFDNIFTVEDLLQACEQARSSLPFETDLANATDHVNLYAERFLEKLFNDAREFLTDGQAAIIGNWVRHLDVYVAVKAVESLLNSQADMALLTLAENKGWNIHFDHMAIRCGSSARQDAERVVRLLCSEHGYVSSQATGEDFYRFPDGWNAYPLYKMLENGQVLRVFVDQSDAGHPQQIIQHWNHVYGYTAHHLAMRATQFSQGRRVAVSLHDVINALCEQGIKAMTPTGMYTEGLLQQVFTQPERNDAIPRDILEAIARVDPELEKKIGNGKLLELVSRREMPPEIASAFFALYGLRYEADNPLHSAPAYQYFLPAQAAHVIKTSVQI